MLKHFVAISGDAFEVPKLKVTYFSVPWTSRVRYGQVDKAGRLSEAMWTGLGWIFWPELIFHFFSWWILVKEQENAWAFLCEALDLHCMSWSQNGDVYLTVWYV